MGRRETVDKGRRDLREGDVRTKRAEESWGREKREIRDGLGGDWG